MEENFNKKDWLEYIIKLNDRENEKRNASGITMWALLAFLGYLLFSVVNILPNLILHNLYWQNTIASFTIIFNFYSFIS